MILDTVAATPEPQFHRPRMMDLTGEWEFAHDDADSGLEEAWFAPGHALPRRITVPFPPESPRSGIHDTEYHRVLWYRRNFDDPRDPGNDRLLVKFGAVDYAATVWVNGRFVGNHEGGSTPFTIDVSSALAGVKGPHVITVRIEDDPEDIEQPRGKQDWQPRPHVIHYERTSGIWQPVWLEVAPAVRIESYQWRFDRSNWTLALEGSLSAPAKPDTALRIELEGATGPIASTTVSVQGRRLFAMLDVTHGDLTSGRTKYLWSPRNPYLLGARLTLTTPDASDDEVLTYVGMRTIETRGRDVLLNGERLYQRLVLNQGYWPESHLSAPSADALKREVELILELGFNGARNHQKIEDPRFLYWADRLGLLVWGEIGNAFTYSDRATDRHAREWREAVVRDRNHPSIITWVPFNESWGVDDVTFSVHQQHAVKAAYHATHQLDGTRPVIGNDGWENVIGDLFTIHDYAWDPAVLTRRYGRSSSPETMAELVMHGHRSLAVGDYEISGKPVILSEFGGVSFAPGEGDEWFGYGKVGTAEQFIEKYRELMETVTASNQLAGFCYTQLTDTVQETNGLLTENREPKVDINEIRKATQGGAPDPWRPSPL